MYYIQYISGDLVLDINLRSSEVVKIPTIVVEKITGEARVNYWLYITFTTTV